MNLSTVPSKRFTHSATSAKNPSIKERHVSSSTLPASSIELSTSTNITVTCLRSPSTAAAGATTSSCTSAWPQPLQNFCPTGFAVPQSAHSIVALSAVPHSPQNRAASTFSVPHFGQVMVPRAEL